MENITVIHKKGIKHVYRLVSLTSIVCKILEFIVREFTDYVYEIKPALQKQKIWFCRGKVHDLTAVELPRQVDWSPGYVDVVYCDFLKAFGTFPYGRLIQVLSHYEVDDNLVTWIKGFSHEQKTESCGDWPTLVVVCGKKWYTTGVRNETGTFVVYISIMVGVVDKSELFSFADDANAPHEISSNSDANELQADLNRTCAWSGDSLLRFHPVKRVSMRIERIVPDHEQEYQMNGFLLSRSEAKFDLGVDIEQGFSFDKHVSAKIKTNSLARIIRRLFEIHGQR